MQRSFLVSLWIGFALRAQTPDYKDQLNAGQQALERGDYQSAVAAFRPAAKTAVETVLPPGDTHQILVRYAEALVIVGNYEEAESAADAAVRMVPAPELAARARIVTARSKAFRGAFGGALQDLQSARQNAEHDGRVLSSVDAAQLEVLLAGGRIQQAAQLKQGMGVRIEQAADLSLAATQVDISVGDYSGAERLLGLPVVAAGSPLERLRRSVLRARVLASSGRWGAAMREFATACRDVSDRLGPAHPETATCWAEAGTSAYWGGRRSEATEWLRKAAESLSRYPDGQPMGMLRLLIAGYEPANSGQLEQARGNLDRARSADVTLFGENSTAVAEVDLLLADAEIARKQFPEAQARLNRVLAAVGTVRPGHAVRLRALLDSAKCAADRNDWRQAATQLADWRKSRPENSENHAELSAAMLLEAEAVARLGRPAEAESLLVKAISMLESALDAYLRLAEVRSVLHKPREAADALTEGLAHGDSMAPATRAGLLLKLADWREAAGQPGEAGDALVRAVDAGAAGGADSPPILERAARLMKTAGRQADAIEVLRRDFLIRERIGQARSEESLSIAEEVAEFEHARQNFGAALPLWQQLSDAGRSGLGIGARNRAMVFERLAEAQQALQQNEDAALSWIQLARLVMLQENLGGAEDFANRARQIAPVGSREVATAFQLLASIRLQRADGQPSDDEDAERYLRQALELAGSDPGARALSLAGLARMYIKKDKQMASQRCAEAEAEARDLPSPVVQATVLATRALILAQQGRIPEAQAKYSDFLTAERAMDYERDFPLLPLLAEASRFYSPQSNLDAVETIDRRRVDATRYAFGNHSPETARALESLASTLTLLKKFSEAQNRYRESLSIFEASPGGKPAAAAVLALLGDLASGEGRTADALDYYQKAAVTDPKQERNLLAPIANAQLQMKDSNGAVASYSRLAEILDDGSANPNWVNASRGKCVALIRAGRYKEGFEASKILRNKVRAANGNKDSLPELAIVRALSEAMRMAGQTKGAADLDKEAAKIAKTLHVEN
jgi:tetratricopeptide (TPR) repeat protein